MPTRRAFTLAAIGAGAAALLSVAASALAFALSPLVRRKAAGGALDLGAEKDFAGVRSGASGPAEVLVTRSVEDSYMTRRVKERLAIVPDPRAATGLVALSTTCTHLGCAVSWNPGRKAFLCPCHGGVYAEDGRVLSGPPPRPLARYPLVVAAGRLTVDASSFEA